MIRSVCTGVNVLTQDQRGFQEGYTMMLGGAGSALKDTRGRKCLVQDGHPSPEGPASKKHELAGPNQILAWRNAVLIARTPFPATLESFPGLRVRMDDDNVQGTTPKILDI